MIIIIMELIIYILYSVNNNFKVNYYYKIKINKKVGEGTYGLVYEINKNMVIKVFKNYTNLNENKDDKKIIPNKNENRELNFFISYLKSNVKNSYIIDINAIGIIKFITGSKLKIINNYCIILPNCYSIVKLINLWKMPLIKNKDGKELVLKFMKRLVEIELFLNDKFKITNLDIKLNNYMIQKNKKLDINNILAIDFGLIVKMKDDIKYNFNINYYIWPKGKDINIEYVSSYSLCINGLILYLGETKIKNSSLKDNLNYLKNDVEFYNIFYNGLLLKIKCSELYLLIKNYMKKMKIKF